MTKAEEQALFEFLKSHLKIKVTNCVDCGGEVTYTKTELLLLDPATGEYELVSRADN